MTSRTFYLDSHMATTSTSGEWTWLYPQKVQLGAPGSHVRCSVHLMAFFNVIPNVIAGVNDTLNLIVNGVSYAATVSGGQYSELSLIDALSGQIGAVVMTFDSATMRYVFTCPTSFTLLGSSTLGASIGFRNGAAYTAAADSTGQYTLTSPNVLSLGGTTYLEITSSLHTFNVANTDAEGGHVLCRVPLIVPYGDSQVYGGESNVFSTIKDNQITELSIRIKDDQGRPADFQGTRWVMSLYLEALPQAYADLSVNYEEEVK